MRSGTKHLRIASVIQIILGIASIALTYFLVGSLTSKDFSSSRNYRKRSIRYIGCNLRRSCFPSNSWNLWSIVI